MVNIRTNLIRVLLNTFMVISVIIIVYYVFQLNNNSKPHSKFLLPYHKSFKSYKETTLKEIEDATYNVWLIFTKVSSKSPLRFKFNRILENLLKVSSVPLKFHIIVDSNSKPLAEEVVSLVVNGTKSVVNYSLYDINESANKMDDIVQVMVPHFSSSKRAYYRDVLFYISLGLHRIAPESQKYAIMLDCDLFFKKDVALLFQEFKRFKPTALFGLAPELSPVYRHVLRVYKSKHNTTFGDYYHYDNNIIHNSVHPKGFQGYNSGVMLFNFSAIRESNVYKQILKNESVQYLTEKYNFKGHLGDQDFYTLMGFEYPDLIQTLNCGFNRQLCTWWKDKGYSDLFDFYNVCLHPIVVLHGNCNTRIPHLTGDKLENLS